jgi:hypothetical protein
MYTSELLDELPRRFANYEFRFRSHETQLWLDMQQLANPKDGATESFLKWLAGMDFDLYQRSQPRRATCSRALARRVAALAPALRAPLRRAAGARIKRLLP